MDSDVRPIAFRASRRLAYLAIAALAILLVLPAILGQARVYDSFFIDWVWADQFTEQLRNGNLYPRWLPLSHGGLGSPVFYYYPPLSFYLTGLIGLTGVSTYSSVVFAFGMGFALSGIAMYEWLLGWTNRPLICALLYMAAPYHLLDFYVRGALAEFTAICLIPLVALGVRRAIADGRLALLALAYGAMILTHLPLALLTSLVLVGPYAFLLAHKQPRRLLTVALAVGLGIALSGIYLLPALALESFRDASQLWQYANLQASNWSILRWNNPGPPEAMRIIVTATILTIVIPGVFLAAVRRSPWAAYAVLCCALAAGLVPAFWDLPLVKMVQFPFRTLPLAEFALVTALALLPRLSPLLLALPMVASAILLGLSPPNTGFPSIEVLAADHPDVPENLPPGEREHSAPSKWALALARSHQSPVARGTETIEPIFYFPAWQVICAGAAVPTYPDPQTQLLTHQGHDCDRMLVWTEAEKAGAISSLVAIIAILMFAAAGNVTEWRGLRRKIVPATS